MPVAFGDHLMFALYDSGASITQVSPKAIEPLLPYLEELDTDKVQFVSAENRSLRKMRLFPEDCLAVSLPPWSRWSRGFDRNHGTLSWWKTPC